MITMEFKDFDELKAFAQMFVHDLGIPQWGPEAPVQQPAQQAPPVAPVQQQPAQQTPPVAPVQQHPAQRQYATQATVPAQGPAVTPVATSTATYALDDLSRAAMTLMDSGSQGDLIALLGRFGVLSLPDLHPDQYGAFATALRELGAQI